MNVTTALQSQEHQGAPTAPPLLAARDIVKSFGGAQALKGVSLDILPGEVRHFGTALRDAAGRRLKVPHMGWNEVRQERAHPLWRGIPDMTRFYFVHSYYVDAIERELLAGSVRYGVDFDAALARGNLFAVQFHPEKSHTAGLQLLRNFLEWNGRC